MTATEPHSVLEFSLASVVPTEAEAEPSSGSPIEALTDASSFTELVIEDCLLAVLVTVCVSSMETAV